MKTKNYYAMTEEELFQNLKTSEVGLTKEESYKRNQRYGYNELPKKKPDSFLKIFISQLLDPIVLLLIVAIIASIFVGEYVDAITITVIITIDLLMGTYQEKKANSTKESLEKLVKEQVKVIRNGKEILLDSKEITIGDYVLLESGDKVSADIRIIESHNLTVDESILTGESLAVEKTSKKLKNNLLITKQTNMVFAGTSITTGRACGIVVAIATNTQIGQIATTISNTKEEKSPLTIRVEKFSKQITVLIVSLSIIIFTILFIKGYPLEEILLSVIALGVSAMPEGLPLALTMALTIASNKMAKQKVVTKKLHSVESLGSCTVIASDKTGTLTVNEQTAKKIITPNNNEYLITGTGYSTTGEIIGEKIEEAKQIAKLGVINNEAKFSASEKIGDSIDIAFLVLGEKAKTNIKNIDIIETIPYESINKYSAVFYKEKKEMYCTVKGSIEKVLSLCNKANKLKNYDEKKFIEQNERLAEEGYRVIAIANGKIERRNSYKEEDIKNLTFMGLVAFIDPIRKEAVSAIKKCKQAGIKVLMITGDHPKTAYKIAKDLKLVNNFSEVTTSDEVEEELLKGEKSFDEFVKTKKVYTRVTPLEKLKIVESLKRQKEFVAVTGDGVNDAPALKTANIGIAMGSGTDIAKETSKMIVMDDNFNSIVNGILEGRVAYSNIRKICYFLISCGLAEVLFFILSIITNMPVPLIAIQLLWLNVVTDGIQDFALSFEKPEKDIMKEPPRNPEESLFDKVLLQEILISGITIGLIVFGVWYYLINIINMETEIARGYVVVLMVIIQNIHAFNCRSEKNSLFTIPISSNYIFIIGVIGSILLGVAAIEIPLLSKVLKTTTIPLLHIEILFLIGLIIFIVMECYKKIKYHK